MILDQQFVAHLVLPADGPAADAAHRGLVEIWRGCTTLLHLTDPVPGTGLPPMPPATPDGLPPGGEHAVAALQHPAAHSQVILRRHHDVLLLSVALAPPEAAAPVGPAPSVPWLWWRILDHQWQALVGAHLPYAIGESRIYLARVDAREQVASADPALHRALDEVLPDAARGRHGQYPGVRLSASLALWENLPEPDERALRRFVLAVRQDADPEASGWIWSDGGSTVPPLARYLLHAAKLRYQLLVWQRDGQARRLRETIDLLVPQVRVPGADRPAKAEQLREYRRDAMLLRSGLQDMRRTAEIAADNLGRALDLAGPCERGGPFADDLELAHSFVERLEDEVAYLAAAASRAGIAAAPSRRPRCRARRSPAPVPPPSHRSPPGPRNRRRRGTSSSSTAGTSRPAARSSPSCARSGSTPGVGGTGGPDREGHPVPGRGDRPGAAAGRGGRRPADA